MNQSLPLSGVKVLELGQLIAIPSATQSLAQMGADVIKVEPPSGDLARSMGPYGAAIWHAFNRGKRSVVLDLKSPEGARCVRRLIGEADVVCHNFRPGTMAKLGLDSAALRSLNRRVIDLQISGFGAAGPSARRAGLDIAAQAESGLMSVTGPADGAPHRVGVPIIDMTASYWAVKGVLASLLQRERTGEGAAIHISLLQVAIHLQTTGFLEEQFSGMPLGRGNGQPNLAPAADVIDAADGSFVVTAYTSRHFRVLAEVLGRPDLADDPRFTDNPGRVAHRSELLRQLSKSVRDDKVEDVVARLTSAGLVAAVIRDYGDVREAEDVVANDYFVDYATAAAPDARELVMIPATVLPESMVDAQVALGSLPELGEHTDAILAELDQGWPAPQ